MSAGIESQGSHRADRELRSARIIRATLTLDGREDRDVIVRNLSTYGVGATCRKPPPSKGELVTIHLPGGIEAKGDVRWAKGQAFGVALDQKLDIPAIETALQRRLASTPTSDSWEVDARHKVHTPRVDPTTLRRV